MQFISFIQCSLYILFFSTLAIYFFPLKSSIHGIQVKQCVKYSGIDVCKSSCESTLIDFQPRLNKLKKIFNCWLKSAGKDGLVCKTEGTLIETLSGQIRRV